VPFRNHVLGETAKKIGKVFNPLRDSLGETAKQAHGYQRTAGVLLAADSESRFKSTQTKKLPN
jgi:hypothetical protein